MSPAHLKVDNRPRHNKRENNKCKTASLGMNLIYDALLKLAVLAVAVQGASKIPNKLEDDGIGSTLTPNNEKWSQPTQFF
jgi:hypothetical protein